MTAQSLTSVSSSEHQRVDPESSVTVSTSQKAVGAFRTISEVADELNVPQHVLRFWETKFFQVRPVKRSGGRRYYRPEDVALLKHIHHLLYSEGYTIRGVQKLLKGVSKSALLKDVALIQEGAARVPVMGGDPANASDASMVAVAVADTAVQVSEVVEVPVELEPVVKSMARRGLTPTQRSALNVALAELKGLRALIEGA